MLTGFDEGFSSAYLKSGWTPKFSQAGCACGLASFWYSGASSTPEHLNG
ncbi:MAG: hypothetical protein AB1782_16245 [Cyanobacteriota bacterium]